MTEPANDFEKAIVQFCKDLGEMLIDKNRKYGDSFRNLRLAAKNNPNINNPRMPLWLHQMEKLSRYMTDSPGDREDIRKDGAGYWALEAVCAMFDDCDNCKDYRSLSFEDSKNQNK
jgi:hypothetical protein